MTKETERQVEDYKIVTACDYLSINDQLKNFINAGYEPYGKIKVKYNNEDGYRYIQAMIKYKQ